jgi:hypothetical protein
MRLAMPWGSLAQGVSSPSMAARKASAAEVANRDPVFYSLNYSLNYSFILE